MKISYDVLYTALSDHMWGVADTMIDVKMNRRGTKLELSARRKGVLVNLVFEEGKMPIAKTSKKAPRVDEETVAAACETTSV